MAKNAGGAGGYDGGGEHEHGHKLSGDRDVQGGWNKQPHGHGRSMGHLHPEATGEGAGTKIHGPATGHAGHMKGRSHEKVTEHHRK